MKISSIQNISHIAYRNNISNPIGVSFRAKNKDQFEKEITLYRNPITNIEDPEFSEIVDIVSTYGIKNAFDITTTSLNPDGSTNDVLFRILDLFYITTPLNFNTAMINFGEKIKRIFKIGTTGIAFMGGDSDPKSFLEAIKNNNGEFSKKNEKFLYKLLAIASNDYHENGLPVSEVSDLIAVCKDDKGEIDDEKQRVATTILKKTKQYRKTKRYIKAYFNIPNEKREYVTGYLGQVDSDEKNNILNFYGASSFCFNENNELIPENFEYYKKLLQVNDTELGDWTFIIANKYPLCRDFILNYAKTSLNLPYESYFLAQFLDLVEFNEENCEPLFELANNYYQTNGTFLDLREFFDACIVSKAEEVAQEGEAPLELNKDLFNNALRLIEEEKQINSEDNRRLTGILPVLILSGKFRAETLPYSKRIELKEVLSKLKETSFASDAINLALDDINNSLSVKDIKLPIDNKTKHDFIAEILKSENNQYTNFEKTLVDAIPLLENLEGGIELYYPREFFLEAIYEASPSLEKFNEVIKKLGITINAVYEDESQNIPASYDGFVNINALDKNDEFEANVYDIAYEYLFENSVNTKSDELNKYLNIIIKTLPEFINIIGKEQHQTQKHSLDVHCLLTLAYSIQNPEYLQLNSADKATLKFSALLHDIAKKEFVVDSGHQYLSSEYVKSIGSKIFSHPRAQERVCEFVCNHHWLADYSNDVRGFSPTEVAIRFRRPNDFKMAKIMSKADLMAVSPEFYNRLKEALSDEKLKYIQDNIDVLSFTTNLYLTDRFVNKRKLLHHIQIKDGVEYKVIDLKAIPDDADMGEFGFERGKKKNDLRFGVHMLNEDELALGLSTLKSLENPANNGVLSESIIAPNATRTYRDRKHGVIVSHLTSNILAANYENMFSGYEKDLSSYVVSLLESSKSVDYRSSFINDFLGALGYDGEFNEINDEYLDFYWNNLANLTSFEQINPEQEFIIKDLKFTGAQLKYVLNALRDELIDFSGKTHNEIIAYLPTIEGVISKADSLDELPKELLDFANQNNLPIVLI